MPTMKCKCGFVLYLNVIPNPYQHKFHSAEEGVLIDATQAKAIEKAIAELKDKPLEEIQSDIILSTAYLESEFYKCPQCGRLIVFWNDDEVGTSYVPEPS